MASKRTLPPPSPGPATGVFPSIWIQPLLLFRAALQGRVGEGPRPPARGPRSTCLESAVLMQFQIFSS